MSETKKCNDNWGIYFLIIWLPIMMMVVIINSDSDSENDLLTDEQKLEKQKELTIKKEQDELKKQQDAQWWDTKISYVIVDKPPIAVFGVGVILLLSLVIFLQSSFGRSWFDEMRYHGWWSLFNVKTIFILMIGILYLMWVTGFGIFGDATLFESSQDTSKEMQE